jgi:hypothetical protein
VEVFDPASTQDDRIYRQTHTLISYDADHIQNDASNKHSIVVFIRCHGNVFTEPMPCNDTRGYTYGHEDWWQGFMKYAVEMGSVAMIYIPSSMKIGSGIQKLM